MSKVSKQIFKTIVICFLLVLLSSCSSSEEDSESNANEIKRTVVINEVDPFFNRVEIFNASSSDTFNVSDYWLCANGSEVNTYLKLQEGELISGTFDLGPGEFLHLNFTATIIASEFDASDAGLGLYKEDLFDNPAAMVDYVKYGPNAPLGKEEVAVEAGLWREGDSVDVANMFSGDSISRVINGTGENADSWRVSKPSSLGEPN